MSERGVGKPWTPYEDNLLIQAVAIHGENDNWKAVALSVPGRTNKACRKRWLHSLSPNVKKTAWTPEEDQLLLSLYAIHGTKWSVIARHIPGRTDDACSKRYREALDPALKRDEWTSEEDAKLLEAHARLGGKWGLIGQELSRSGLGCRNRWRMLERKRVAASRDNAARGDTTSQTAASTSQWTPGHAPAQDAQSWDGRSPQYVNPSMLMNNSPAHSQECRTPAYLPEQILSGAHLAGGAAASPAHQPFQYGSSALGGGGLSHPGSVAHSPNPHEYYASVGRYSPPVSQVGAPAPHPQGRQSSPGEFVPSGLDAHTAPGTTQHVVDHRSLHLNPDAQGPHASDPSASQSRLPDDDGQDMVPDTPASPSAAGSPLPADSRSPSPTAENGRVYTAPNHDTIGTRSYYRTDAEKAQLSTAPRRPLNSQRPSRLSSLLPATSDASVLAYACGHRDCWPADADSSKHAFATSKELSDHSKLVHGGDLGGNKPFRCALKGCEKSWKSINGLQYHLQISKVHFQRALAARQPLPNPIPPAPQPAPSQAHTELTPPSSHHPVTSALIQPEAPDPASDNASAPPERENDKDKDKEKDSPREKPRRKLHPCPHPGCSKQYKQLSGLRYHLSHGHAEELPMQLDVVPPTLARLVAEKGRG